MIEYRKISTHHIKGGTLTPAENIQVDDVPFPYFPPDQELKGANNIQEPDNFTLANQRT